MERKIIAWQVKARKGMTWKGKAWNVKEMQGMIKHGMEI
jgi:hypothetical protein